MEPLYSPEGVEERWQRTWEEEGLYNADPDPSRESFVDRASRRRTSPATCTSATRSSSRSPTRSSARGGCRATTCLFQPGYDHAGISTQNVVEKELAAAGKVAPGSRPRGVRGARLGVAARVRRQDHDPVPAHRRVDGLPARALHDGRRLRPRGDALLRPPLGARAGSTARTGSSTGARSTRPRSPTSSSTTSEVDDALVYVRYPLADGDGHITIATVRPATILADVAVAVHPDDERYRDLVGTRGGRARSSSAACR